MILTLPSGPRFVCSTTLIGQEFRGRALSTIRTTSPACRSRILFFDSPRGTKIVRYSWSQLFQNCSAIDILALQVHRSASSQGAVVVLLVDDPSRKLLGSSASGSSGLRNVHWRKTLPLSTLLKGLLRWVLSPSRSNWMQSSLTAPTSLIHPLDLERLKVWSGTPGDAITLLLVLGAIPRRQYGVPGRLRESWCRCLST